MSTAPDTLGDGSVVIIGAGPAGSAAAITLRRAGADVTVIDKARFPREKCCGDGLTAGALRHLDDLGVTPNTIPSWTQVRDVHVISPSGHDAHFPLPGGSGQFAAVARRTELDAALVDRARACGATVREGQALIDVELYDDRVLVTTDSGSISAQWCIAADGMWSPTRKALGLQASSYLGEWHAVRQYVTGVSPRASKELFVWFEPDILPGYVWSFPLPNGRANVGFGVRREGRKGADMKKLWPALLDRPHIREIVGTNAVAEDRYMAWPIPARVGELPLTAHRTFFVGDATGACDPLTGEGIGQALQTGIGAAQAIIDSTSAAGAASAYEADTEHNLAVDMRFAGQLSSLLSTPFGANAAIKTASMTDWTSRNFARWLFEDYPRAVLGTPRRWSRDMFSRPGAYVG